KRNERKEQYKIETAKGATIKVKSNQTRPVRAWNSRGENYRPYIKEQAKSRGRKTNKKENPQQSSQKKRRGAKTNSTLSVRC
ncbi:hypothetical protein TNIN_106801, partial [Trichonephila inaurata madagascariensis]